MRRQAERNRKLYEYYLQESDKHGATYGDVGKVFGVCASRAFRIVKAEEKRLATKMTSVVHVNFETMAGRKNV